jgi:hypothetical protein
MAKDLQGKNLTEWFLERDDDDPTFVSPRRPPKVVAAICDDTRAQILSDHTAEELSRGSDRVKHGGPHLHDGRNPRSRRCPHEVDDLERPRPSTAISSPSSTGYGTSATPRSSAVMSWNTRTATQGGTPKA